jgi:ABC-2 type transport system ATP-binding protein
MIEVRHLRKQYDGQVALENLHLDIPRGEVFGLIGPNGAGKTTLIRILATLLEPTYGSVRIDGIDALAEPLRVHPLLGYMSDFFSLYDYMLVREYLDHFALCYGIERRQRDKLVEQVLQLVSLDVRRESLVGTLSRGMRQRLCLARALLHQPKLLLLDEPASGLDPAGRCEFRALIKQLHEMGHTLIISSHILVEMADFCTSIGILEQGKLLAHGRVEDILLQLDPGLLLEIEVLAGQEQLMQLLKEEPRVDRLEGRNGQVRCRWRGERQGLPELHRRIVAAGVELVALAVKSDSIEDIYMTISGHRTS